MIKLLAKKGLEIREVALVENTMRVWAVSTTESPFQDSPKLVLIRFSLRDKILLEKCKLGLTIATFARTY